MKTNKLKMISVGSLFSALWRLIIGLITVFLVFVAVVLAYDKYVEKARIPSFFGKSALVIATPSMSGSIEAGDLIIITKSYKYELDDIITYFPAGEGTSVTHRIVRIEGEKYYTKGDANNSEDPDPVFITQIAGKMTGSIPKVGIIIEWLSTWQGIAFIIAVGAVVVAIVTIADGYEDEEEEVEETENAAEETETTEEPPVGELAVTATEPEEIPETVETEEVEETIEEVEEPVEVVERSAEEADIAEEAGEEEEEIEEEECDEAEEYMYIGNGQCGNGIPRMKKRRERRLRRLLKQRSDVNRSNGEEK